jgi:hypothetical protein
VSISLKLRAGLPGKVAVREISVHLYCNILGVEETGGSLKHPEREYKQMINIEIDCTGWLFIRLIV